jgi:isocitrate/isopropylmalate dehydrogenase
MLETLGLKDEAAAVDAAILATVQAGEGTPDIGGTMGTKETGDRIVKRIQTP